MTSILTVLLLALASAPSSEAKSKVYMWGVGGRIGTIAIPSHYPWGFPPKVGESESIEKVGGDILFGGEGMYWLDKTSRLGAIAGIGAGSGYSDMNIMLKYDRMGSFDALDSILGAGLGFGQSKWKGEGPEELRVPYYPLRVEAGLLMRQKIWAIQGLIFGQYNLPSNHYYTDPSGAEVDVGTGFYGLIGVELGAFYGDFKAPKKKSKSKNKKN